MQAWLLHPLPTEKMATEQLPVYCRNSGPRKKARSISDIYVLYLFLQVSPGCGLTSEYALYLLRSQIFDGVVIVYNYCDTVVCDNCSGKASLGLRIFQLSGSHSDIADTVNGILHTGCGITGLNLNLSFIVYFCLSLFQFLHYR